MPTDSAFDIYTLLKDSIIAAAAIGGVFVAHEGLQTWKAQLRGTIEYELTRRLLRSTYKYRDGFSIVRHPVMFSGEYPPLPDGFKGTREEERYHGLSGAYSKRWDRLQEARRELDAELLEAEVLWDAAIRERYVKLFKLQGELFSVVSCYLSACNPRSPDAAREADENFLRDRRDALYETNLPEDEFSRQLRAAVMDVESILKPHLRR